MLEGGVILARKPAGATESWHGNIVQDEGGSGNLVPPGDEANLTNGAKNKKTGALCPGLGRC
jgi:hypothetical protein